MILLRQKCYSGKFWAGTKGAIKSGSKGALWGAVLMPGKLIALKKGNYKVAGGLAAGGALIGAGIGAKSGWNEGVRKYKYDNDPKYRAKVDKENEKIARNNIQSALGEDKVYISEMNYQGWVKLSKEIPVPEEFMNYLKFYNTYWSKKVDFWYSNMDPEVYKDESRVPEFKYVFPIPIDPRLAKEWYEDDYLCLATDNNAGDDGWVCYDTKEKLYGWDVPDSDNSLKELLLDHTNSIQKYLVYSPAQKKLVEEFKNKIKSL